MNTYILVCLYFAAFTKLICTWYMEIQILTSFVSDMLIYYVPMATEEKAKRCQNVECAWWWRGGAVPHGDMDGLWLERRRKQGVVVKLNKMY